eukprot:CAMPEP_0194348898 /NCGR_PEP_ID=MMETSP0171-20130528/106790_1 /TAXON_ID=218684 /ORGANISM="Corethron pennatum, Strain L29A3" /LENGTH=92 /DNA_ID=CAMNT_0039116289 /DNA_START=1090 /DNA_END=1369 /DNA_ORIENTATION=-
MALCDDATAGDPQPSPASGGCMAQQRIGVTVGRFENVWEAGGGDRVRPYHQGGASEGAGGVREVAGPRSPALWMGRGVDKGRVFLRQKELHS